MTEWRWLRQPKGPSLGNQGVKWLSSSPQLTLLMRWLAWGRQVDDTFLKTWTQVFVHLVGFLPDQCTPVGHDGALQAAEKLGALVSFSSLEHSESHLQSGLHAEGVGSEIHRWLSPGTVVKPRLPSEPHAPPVQGWRKARGLVGAEGSRGGAGSSRAWVPAEGRPEGRTEQALQRARGGVVEAGETDGTQGPGAVRGWEHLHLGWPSRWAACSQIVPTCPSLCSATGSLDNWLPAEPSQWEAGMKWHPSALCSDAPMPPVAPPWSLLPPYHPPPMTPAQGTGLLCFQHSSGPGSAHITPPPAPLSFPPSRVEVLAAAVLWGLSPSSPFLRVPILCPPLPMFSPLCWIPRKAFLSCVDPPERVSV